MKDILDASVFILLIRCNSIAGLASVRNAYVPVFFMRILGVWSLVWCMKNQNEAEEVLEVYEVQESFDFQDDVSYLLHIRIRERSTQLIHTKHLELEKVYCETRNKWLLSKD
jgi:hypothetical protein